MYDLSQDMEKKGNIESKVYTLQITGYDIVEDKEKGYEYIDIKFKEVSNEFFSYVRQSLAKTSTGEYKNPLYSGFKGADGIEIPASTLWDLKEAIKTKLGEEGYEIRKTAKGGVNKEFFMDSEFDMEIKKSKSGDKTYFIPMTSKQKVKDEEYLRSNTGNFVDSSQNKPDNSKRVAKALDQSGLPF
ncbi:MAG: hypothetical protein SH817_09925 [Leptospira sp.]|nr:hypothetical protein [Leptospira sp.]